MRCALCGKEAVHGEDHGAGFCSTVKISIEPAGEQGFSVGIGNDPSTSHQYMTKGDLLLMQKKIAKALDEPNPDLTLNPSRLPTRAQLYDVVSKSELNNDIPAHPQMMRVVYAMGCLRVYCNWLPEQHRVFAERDLEYIARRLEDLTMCLKFFQEIRKWNGLLVRRETAQQIMSEVSGFVQMLLERTGLRLWE